MIRIKLIELTGIHLRRLDRFLHRRVLTPDLSSLAWFSISQLFLSILSFCMHPSDHLLSPFQ